MCVRKKRVCYAEYLDKVQSSIKFNVKLFWSYVNSKCKILDIPGSVFLNNVEAEKSDDIVKLFAAQFQNSFNLSDPILPTLSDLPALVSDVTISGEELMNTLLKFNKSSGSGPDQVPALYIVNCAKYLLDPILHIFNSSLASGVFPSAWKSSFIRPIYRKGSRHVVQNYRPVATGCALANQ